MDLATLIGHLQRLRKSHGGDAEVFVGDRKIPHHGWTVGGFEVTESVDNDGDTYNAEITINPARA